MRSVLRYHGTARIPRTTSVLLRGEPDSPHLIDRKGTEMLGMGIYRAQILLRHIMLWFEDVERCQNAHV